MNKEAILKEIDCINKRISEISQHRGVFMNETEKIIYSDLCENRKDLYKKLYGVI